MKTKERPVLMSGPMVRATLDGSKTKTRRVMKPQPAHVWGWGVKHDEHDFCAHVRYPGGHQPDPWVRCPYGATTDRECGGGGRLWVRETWAPRMRDGTELHYGEALYKADYADAEMFPTGRWRPSIHMPRWASRLTLEITSIRVERLQDITEEDARAEGVHVASGHMFRPLGSKEPMQPYTHRQAFAALWDEINGKRGYTWESSPWVWVISFATVEALRDG